MSQASEFKKSYLGGLGWKKDPSKKKNPFLGLARGKQRVVRGKQRDPETKQKQNGAGRIWVYAGVCRFFSRERRTKPDGVPEFVACDTRELVGFRGERNISRTGARSNGSSREPAWWMLARGMKGASRHHLEKRMLSL